MTKDIFVKGVLASIPIIAIAQAFFYLTSRSGLAEDFIVYLKPFLYVVFVTFAIGLPIYFYIRESRHRLFKMVISVAISWCLFSVFTTISAFVIYPGLAKDIEPSLLNITIYFLKWFILGTVVLSLICSFVKVLYDKRNERGK